MRWLVVLPIDFHDAGRRACALAARTSLGVGGRPRFLFEPESQAQAGAVVRACLASGVPVRYLGGGYNILVDDGSFGGAVVATRRLRHFRVSEDRVEVGAGNSFPRLVRDAIALGIPALPGCPGIPGSVGGVVFMNAGGRFGSVGEALLEVSGLDPDGGLFRRRIQEGDLGYRRSIFGGHLITGAVFRRDGQLEQATQQALFDKSMAWKRETQPLAARSAGCMFKNPPGRRSAGWLIEQAELKGRRVGGAMVSTQHANFILNVGSATATDVHRLIELIQKEVRRVHGVDLELEVRVW
jgi:UDP-N-acetylmuramate dehydrogenase